MYCIKWLVPAIKEHEENLFELAKVIRAVQLKRIGNPETSKTTQITCTQGMYLPPAFLLRLLSEDLKYMNTYHKQRNVTDVRIL